MDEVTITLTLPTADAIKVLRYTQSLGGLAKSAPLNFGSNNRPGHDHNAYKRAHARVRSARGKASGYRCAGSGCDAPAEHWAYMHTGVDEDECAACGLTSSPDTDSYQPLCARCHKTEDTAHRASIEKPKSLSGHWTTVVLAVIRANPELWFSNADLLMSLEQHGVTIARQTLSTFLAGQARQEIIACAGNGQGRRYSALSSVT